MYIFLNKIFIYLSMVCYYDCCFHGNGDHGDPWKCIHGILVPIYFIIRSFFCFCFLLESDSIKKIDPVGCYQCFRSELIARTGGGSLFVHVSL